MVQWLNKHRTEGCTTNAVDWAAEEGHLNVFQWLDQHRSEGHTTDALDFSAAFGRYEVVKYLYDQHKTECTSIAVDYAARHGHLSILILIYDDCKNPESEALNYAVSEGHLDVVQWLCSKERGWQWYRELRSATARADRKGHYLIAQWLQERKTQIEAIDE